MTSESRVLPGESISVCLVVPIRSPWLHCRVAGAELIDAVPYLFELGFNDPLPENVLTAIAVQMPETMVGSSAKPAATRRVLVVEDHHEMQSLLAELFRRRGVAVAVAGTVAEGLEKLDPPPCCIILDLMLPDGPGEAILHRVCKAGLPSRVVICTGIEDHERLEQVRGMHPYLLLSKPIDINLLFQACQVTSAG